MNEHVSTANPEWRNDFRAFDRQLRAAPLLVLASPPSTSEPSPAPNQASTAQPTQGEPPGRPTPEQLVAHAARRGRVQFTNGQRATLIAARGRIGGNKVLVQLDTGDHWFVAVRHIAALIGAPK